MHSLRQVAVSVLQLGLTPAFQIASLILGSAAVGAAQFGVFSVFQSVTIILVELVGLGSSELMIRRMAVDRTPIRDAFGATIVISLMSFAPILLLYTFMAFLLAQFGASSEFISIQYFGIIFLFGLIELLLGRFILSIEHLAIAEKRSTLANTARMLPPLFRTVLIGTFLIFGFDVSLVVLFLLYSLSTTLAVIVLSTWSIRIFGCPNFYADRPSVRDSIPFSANQFIRAIQGNADRLVLNLFLSASTLGQYSIALRVVQASLLPITAVLRLSYPGMFEAGARGPDAILSYVRQILPMMCTGIGLAILAAGSFAFLSPHLLGDSFSGVTPIAASLALTPALIGFGYLVGDIITGIGRQTFRIAFLIAATAAQYATLFALGDIAGVYSAVAGIYVFHAVFTAACWIKVRQVNREAQKND